MNEVLTGGEEGREGGGKGVVWEGEGVEEREAAEEGEWERAGEGGGREGEGGDGVGFWVAHDAGPVARRVVAWVPVGEVIGWVGEGEFCGLEAEAFLV